MTEAEWLVCGDPFRMLMQFASRREPWFFRWLGRGSRATKVNERKLRLFAAACCRQIWRELNEIQKQKVEAAEEFADGMAWSNEPPGWSMGLNDSDAMWVARSVAEWVIVGESREPDEYTEELDLRNPFQRLRASKQAVLIRDIFGNPFRSITFIPEWRTSTVLGLAGQMYEFRDFSAMPILADALQDAGCEITDVLGHCRGSGPHVRGCWVVDLVLGKE